MNSNYEEEIKLKKAELKNIRMSILLSKKYPEEMEKLKLKLNIIKKELIKLKHENNIMGGVGK